MVSPRFRAGVVLVGATRAAQASDGGAASTQRELRAQTLALAPHLFGVSGKSHVMYFRPAVFLCGGTPELRDASRFSPARLIVSDADSALDRAAMAFTVKSGLPTT